MREPSTTHVYFDGQITEADKARPSLWSYSLHYGYGVFEGLRAYDHGGTARIFRLDEHVERLYASARTLGIPLEHDRAALAEAHHEVLRANGLTAGYIRPIVFVGDGLSGLTTRDLDVHVAILAWSWEAGHAVPPPGVRLCVSARRRPPADSFPPHAKATGNYVVSKLAHNEAVARGYDDAVMLDADGHVAEATALNIFAVRGDRLLTPAPHACLPGITRAAVMELAAGAGLDVREAVMDVPALTGADEVFLTSTAAGVRPVWQVEERPIGSGTTGPVTRRLAELYDDLVSR
ncbi:branched-chain amino acid transaminase [Sphaerisporangium album]|uniref:Branched-chain-amino-acid aminotransferase n=1 Tax=Sphaerisporangium album TaxID=509200 RepID=A0A367F768_9ACTN|nr:branched-chain amino acid transaminase [Sphaerisporangium album]RCG26206.1 branched-chain amino acid transaminase [Sphaerisporangium album]